MMKFNIGTPREATGPHGRPRDPMGGHETQREATGPNAGTRFFGCAPQLIHYQDRQDPYRASSVWGIRFEENLRSCIQKIVKVATLPNL